MNEEVRGNRAIGRVITITITIAIAIAIAVITITITTIVGVAVTANRVVVMIEIVFRVVRIVFSMVMDVSDTPLMI
jgi:uncharacterized Tic20 family protein